MLTVSDLSKSFNIQTLFKKITFSLNPGERVGLIGLNGSGKTTLLRILAGREEPTSGSVHRPANLRIGYLPQGFEADSGTTIGQVIGSAAGNIDALEQELTAAAQALAGNPRNRQLSERYDQLLQKVQSADPGAAASVLANLGLAQLDKDMPVSNLSGGQRTRLALAQVLLSDPQILLLDEPTNHLDVGMLEWLESWLGRTPCGALIVSHDRVFLDHTVTRNLGWNPHSQALRFFRRQLQRLSGEAPQRERQAVAEYATSSRDIRRMKADIARAKAQAAYTSASQFGAHWRPEMKISGAKALPAAVLPRTVAKKAKSREKKLERYQERKNRLEKPVPGARCLISNSRKPAI